MMKRQKLGGGEEERTLYCSSYDLSGDEVGGRDHEKFLQALLLQYESLVDDMHAELIQKCETAKFWMLRAAEDEKSRESHHHDLELITSRKNAIIDNLRMQLDVMNSSKCVLKKLWDSTLAHVEHLEEAQRNNRLHHSSPPLLSPDLLMRWNMLHAHARNLEEKVERLTTEAAFYRKKVLDIQMETQKSKEKTKTEFANAFKAIMQEKETEIKQLHVKLQNMQHQFEQRIQIRLQKERETWEKEEAQAMGIVKVQVDELLHGNQLLIRKEAQTLMQIDQMQYQNDLLKAQLQATLNNMTEITVQFNNANKASSLPRLASSRIEDKQIGDHFDVVPDQKQSSVKSTHAQTETSLISGPGEELTKRHEADKIELETEKRNMEEKLKCLERNMMDTVQRLQSRIHQLNEANGTLSHQHEQLNRKYEEMKLKSHQQQDLIPSNQIKKNQGGVLLGKNQRSEETEFDILKMKIDALLINERKRELQIMRLEQENKNLSAERDTLLELLRKQDGINSKWKLEFKQLANVAIQSTMKQEDR